MCKAVNRSRRSVPARDGSSFCWDSGMVFRKLNETLKCRRLILTGKPGIMIFIEIATV